MESNLDKLQMRFQQKQMQENAQKKTDQMYNSFDLNSSIGAGKVRQMFDERRKIVAGIDKSYLLDPIVTNKKPTPVQKMVTRTEPKNVSTRVHHVPPLANRSSSHDINGNPTNDVFDRSFSRNPFGSGDSFDSKKPTGVTSVNLRTTNTKIVPKSSDSNGNVKQLSNGARKISPTTQSKSVAVQKQSPTKSTRSGTSSASSSASGTRKSTSAKSEVQERERSDSPGFDENEPVPEGLVRCPICKRNFAEDRIEKHEVICQKTKSKKRKVFDSTKKRVQGTEAEVYVKRQQKQPAKAQAPVSSAKNSNWRAKHNEFIRTIREAKKVSEFLAKGGNIRDLPPPPPSENPDYVQCPHCSRKFNEGAAARHIPLCAEKARLKPSAPKGNKAPVARFVGLKKR